MTNILLDIALVIMCVWIVLEVLKLEGMHRLYASIAGVGIPAGLYILITYFT